MFSGEADASIREFYALLPRVERASWPEMLLGLGYNFEAYDSLFALMCANVQTSLESTEYTRRHRCLQALLQPFASEYGLEAGRPLGRTHRALYAEFYQRACGRAWPERYPEDAGRPWLALARRWARAMESRLSVARDRALYSAAYHWAVESLSIPEFESMRAAWNGLGVFAPYLDAHCAVEPEHADWATQAVLALAELSHPVVREAVAAHERDIAGFYREAALLAAGISSDRDPGGLSGKGWRG